MIVDSDGCGRALLCMIPAQRDGICNIYNSANETECV
jgi:hypothetical protein